MIRDSFGDGFQLFRIDTSKKNVAENAIIDERRESQVIHLLEFAPELGGSAGSGAVGEVED